MNTLISIKKLDKDVKGLRNDVREMKKLLLTPMKDQEGEYTGSFVSKMLSRSQSKGPFYRFSGKNIFSKHVQSKK